MRPAVWVAAVLCCALGNVSDAVLVTGSGIHSHSILGLRIGSAAFAQPPTVSNVRMVGFPGCLRRGVQVCVRDSLSVSVGFAGGSGGSVGGRGGSGGGPWDGHWDGGHGGGHRFNGLAYVATKGPRLTNRTVLEPETGVKFPPALLLNPKDKKPVRFLGGECAPLDLRLALTIVPLLFLLGQFMAQNEVSLFCRRNV